MLCATDFRAFKLFNGDGFKAFCQLIVDITIQTGSSWDFSEECPTNQTVRNNLKTIAAEIKSKLIAVLKKVRFYVAVFDHTSCPFTNNSYMSLIIRYSENGRFISRCLMVKHVSGHAAVDIRSDVNQCLRDYQIKETEHRFVHDNCPANFAALRDEERDGCFIHQLNLVQVNSFKQVDSEVSAGGRLVDNSLKNISALMDKCKKLVGFVKRAGLNSQFNPTLKQDVVTRFDSKYIHLNSVLVNQASIVESDNATIRAKGDLDYDLLSKLVGVLKLFYDSRLIAGPDEKSTFQLVLPLKRRLERELRPSEDEDCRIARLKAILLKFVDLKIKINDDHMLATLLTPKFVEMKGLVDEEERERLLELLRTEVSNSVATVMDDESYEPEDDFFGDFTVRKRFRPECEIDKYLNFNFTKAGVVDDPLIFWGNRKAEFPKLSVFATRLLTIPCSSLLCEQLFSILKNTVSDQRSCLKVDTIEELLFTNSNRDLF